MQDKLFGTYTFHRKGDESFDSSESEYESAEGTIYKPVGEIGSGEFSVATEFRPEGSANKRRKAVLKPLSSNRVDFDEIKRKFNFFTTLYPNEEIDLLDTKSTYRLVLPLLSGNLYVDLILANEEGARVIFLSAIRALRNCHQKGLIVTDLKEEDNILYDEETAQSYLIDGGYSVKKGEWIHPIFTRAEEEIEEYREKYEFNAPECFTLNGAQATEEMDIYSLGSMMQFISSDLIAPKVLNLCHKCLNQIQSKDQP